ncbi:GNAT family N-acetyltransferase [Microbulbifer sp. ANSA005]|uniref:GNAT family N-acetyltransferase n=1 Tax=Microbulbifer sp. ANSA005 TaxID=3243362 RepID=UPI004040F0C4
MEIRLLGVTDAPAISAFYLSNEEHLKRWEPIREPGFHSSGSWIRRISSGGILKFAALESGCDQLLGVCSLTNIIRGPFQACNMGYAVDQSHEGRGLMRSLCRHVVDYAFDTLNLNRVMANYMPGNDRSAALLEALGFVVEGRAAKYLKINGCWEDHILTAKLSPRSLDI